MHVLIIIGLLIRFFKWHIFLRLCSYRIKMRQSLAIFFAGLFVNLFFPLLLGDFITKTYFLRKNLRLHTGKILPVLVLEKFIDLISITLLRIVFFILLGEPTFDPYIIPPNNLIIIGYSAFIGSIALVLFSLNIKIFIKVAVCCLVGILGWFVKYLIYFTLPAGVHEGLSFTYFGYLFSNYLLFYPLTPMGVFGAANYMYLILERIISDQELLWQTALNVRIASIIPAMLLGALGLYKLCKSSEAFHFDKISDEYADMIPAHIQERLIDRKCNLIIDDLKMRGQDSKNLTGLDLGGGKGWHASRIADAIGANIILVERSFNQAKDAVKRDCRIKAVLADIKDLPFKVDSIDFGFSINAFHHLDNEDAHIQAFASLSGILKDRQCFYLHEINTKNIFFRIYMNYVFPLIKTIDEGIECWITPEKIKFGNFISNKIVYFTFMPDFISNFFMRIFIPLEKRLENSPLKKYSAHYFRVFENIKH